MPEQGAGRPGSHVLPRPGELNRSRPAGAVRLAPLPDDGPSGPGQRPAAACRNIAGRVGPLRGAAGSPAPEPRAERQAGVLVVGTPGIHQAAPWPAWGRPGKAGGDKGSLKGGGDHDCAGSTGDL